MKRIFVAAPANRFTGGPTLAHQLCLQLRKDGFDAKMYYYHIRDKKCIVHEKYKELSLPYVLKLEDDFGVIVIAPETAPDILKHIRKGKKVIWWMSVDNYFDKYLVSRRNRILNLGGLLKFKVFSKETIHFAQSQYAINFLKQNNVDDSKIFYLSDYIDDIFIDKTKDSLNRSKEDIIVYSPKRGLEYTEKIIRMLPDKKFVPLENMTQSEMIEIMSKSKLYLDFGNHPGKDRIPREAVLSGCCLITSKRGSANNSIDIAIDEKYKFEDNESNLTEIVTLINDILLNYHKHLVNFNEYRKKILNEKEKFSQDIRDIFQKIAE